MPGERPTIVMDVVEGAVYWVTMGMRHHHLYTTDVKSKREAAETLLFQRSRELAEAREAMRDGRGMQAEMERQMAARDAAEKQKRIEHIGQKAIRRIMQASLSRGFEAWADGYYDALRKKQLLAQAAMRLARPALSSAYAHWFRDWREELAAEEREKAGLSQAQEVKRRKKAEAHVKQLQTEVDELRGQAGASAGVQAEMERRAAEREAEEKQKRIEHIGQKAIRRIMQASLSRGFEAWADGYYDALRKKQLLAQAAMRLTRPMLAASYQFWYRDWKEEELAAATSSAEASYRAESSKCKSAEKQVSKLLEELSEAHAAACRAAVSEASLEAGMAEREAAAKQARIEQIGRRAVQRMMTAALARGFETMAEGYYEQKRKKQLLAQAAMRLAKPALSAAYTFWHRRRPLLVLALPRGMRRG